MIPILTLAAVLMASSTPADSASQKCVPDVGSLSSSGAKADIRRAESEWAASISKDEAAFLRRVTAPDLLPSSTET